MPRSANASSYGAASSRGPGKKSLGEIGPVQRTQNDEKGEQHEGTGQGVNSPGCS